MESDVRDTEESETEPRQSASCYSRSRSNVFESLIRNSVENVHETSESEPDQPGQDQISLIRRGHSREKDSAEEQKGEEGMTEIGFFLQKTPLLKWPLAIRGSRLEKNRTVWKTYRSGQLSTEEVNEDFCHQS